MPAPALTVLAPDEGETAGRDVVVSADRLARLGGGDVERGRRELRMMLADAAAHRVIRGPTTKPAKVRIAGPADETAVVDLIEVDYLENAVHVAPFDADRTLAHVQAGTRRQLGVTAVVDGADGKPVAATVLIPVQWAFSRAYYYQEVFNFVHPDHRKSDLADQLIDFAKWWVDEMTRRFGYRVYLLTSVLSTIRTKQKMRLYGRRVNQMGALYLYPHPPTEA